METVYYTHTKQTEAISPPVVIIGMSASDVLSQMTSGEQSATVETIKTTEKGLMALHNIAPGEWPSEVEFNEWKNIWERN